MHLMHNMKALKLHNHLLSQQNTRLKMQLAFKSLKFDSLSKSLPLSHQFQFTKEDEKNKKLYFEYIAQVLSQKQEQLIAWEQQLEVKQSELNEISVNKTILTKIKFIEEIKNIQNRIHKMGLAFVSADRPFDRQTYTQKYQEIVEETSEQCSKFKREFQDEFKQIYDEIAMERNMLRKKLGQFAELSAYEKYLNELHDALEQKNEEIEKCKRVSNKENCQSSSEYSSKKRHKIFSNKQRQSSQLSQGNQEINNQTFAQDKATESQNKYYKSSQIMDQFGNCQKNHLSNLTNLYHSYQNHQIHHHQTQHHQTQHHYQPHHHERHHHQKHHHQQNHYQKHHHQRHQSPNHVYIHLQQDDDSALQLQPSSIAIQCDAETLENAHPRLLNERKILKFGKLWVKYCLNKSVTFTNKKIFTIYLWYMNTIFDPAIPNKIKAIIDQVQDRYWLRNKKRLMDQKILPYDKLSLKRKKYSELFLELEYKKYQREKLHQKLKSILQNRNRKQRLTFYFYFIRFYKNSMKKQPNAKLKSSQLTTPKYSQIRNQEQIVAPNSQLKKSATNNSITSYKKTPKLPKQTQSRISLQNIENIPKKHTTHQDQIAKLNQYIDEKQRIEKLLATQCVKMQGMIKMSLVFGKLGHKINSQFFGLLTNSNVEDRIRSLYSQINSLEFRLQLIVTKSRLGLANNNNKLSTLENLLGFTNFIK